MSELGHFSAVRLSRFLRKMSSCLFFSPLDLLISRDRKEEAGGETNDYNMRT